MVDFLAVQPIAYANLDSLKTIEDIELGQRQPVDAAGPHGLAHQHRVEPAAAPLASGIDAELLAAAAALLPDPVMQFGRDRPLAYPRRIGLAAAERVAHRRRPHARAGPGL